MPVTEFWYTFGMESVCIFGDSIVNGFNDAEKGGWVSRFRAMRFAQADAVPLYELGIPNETTTTLLVRFDSDAGPRNPGCIIFAIGTHVAHDHAKLLAPEPPPMAFERNLRPLLENALTICPTAQ